MTQANASLVLRRSEERGKTQTDWLKSYHSFSFGNYTDANWHHFGQLRVLNEDWVAPATGFGMHPHRDMEIVTIMLGGRLEHQDSLGNKTQITAGEVQRMTAGTGITHSETNPLADEEAHLLQIWIKPNQKGLESGYEQRPIGSMFEVNGWRQLVSPDGTGNALRIHQAARFWMATLGGEGSLALPATGGHLWLQVTEGTIKLDDTELTAGDAAGLTNAPDSLRLSGKGQVLLIQS